MTRTRNTPPSSPPPSYTESFPVAVIDKPATDEQQVWLNYTHWNRDVTSIGLQSVIEWTHPITDHNDEPELLTIASCLVDTIKTTARTIRSIPKYRRYFYGRALDPFRRKRAGPIMTHGLRSTKNPNYSTVWTQILAYVFRIEIERSLYVGQDPVDGGFWPYKLTHKQARLFTSMLQSARQMARVQEQNNNDDDGTFFHLHRESTASNAIKFCLSLLTTDTDNKDTALYSSLCAISLMRPDHAYANYHWTTPIEHSQRMTDFISNARLMIAHDNHQQLQVWKTNASFADSLQPTLNAINEQLLGYKNGIPTGHSSLDKLYDILEYADDLVSP